jgi:acyl-CoA synthetase (AMP-forming)/AMP-acid ligase II
MKTAYDLVWIAGERTPDHLALVDDRTDRKLTYRQLLAEVDTVAAGLAARGVKAGSRVATVLPNFFEHCVALLAMLRLAAVPALMNARLQPAELANLVVQGEIEGAIIRKDELLAQAIAGALPVGAMLLSVDGAIGKAEDFAACRGDAVKLPAVPRPDPESTAFIFYTSGTTGLPKGVVITHRTSEHRIVWLSTQAGLRQGTHNRTLGMVPISHAIGFYGTLLVTLAYNGTFYTMSAFNPVAANELIELNKINYLFSVPTLYQAIVSASNYKPEKWRPRPCALWRRANHAGPARSHRSRVACSRAPHLRNDRDHVRALQSRARGTAGDPAARLLFARARGAPRGQRERPSQTR